MQLLIIKRRLALLASIFVCSLAWGQAQNSSSSNQTAAQPSAQQPMSGQSTSGQSMPGMDMSHKDMSNGDMSGHDMSNTQMGADSDKAKDIEKDDDANAMHSMEGHMDMGPHMKMTALRQSKPGDEARAQQVVEAARKASNEYKDYHAALADGFKIFHPELPQKMYHFTNYRYAIEAQFRFNPEHPTSLLYEKHGDDYKLIGVMYTAPKRFTENQLDQRIPLSVAQWHEHVNFCVAPPDKRGEGFGPHPQFGLRGSIDTKDACDAAHGTFLPVVFNWMVHVYPFERDQASIWSVERQHGDAD